MSNCDLAQADGMAMRSFGVVDQKLEEADFFCDRIAESGTNFFATRCYFSAFVAAARSVTFAVQGSIKTLAGFDDWYSGWQERLRKEKLTRFFHDCRTDSQHLGLCPIKSGAVGRGEAYCFFGQPEYGRYDWLPDLDVASACREQMRIICELVEDCYRRFGMEIDPDQIYTPEGLKLKGWTLEDVEEQLGFPRGYTDIPWDQDSNKDLHRLNALRREIAMPGIWPTVRKYRDAPPATAIFSEWPRLQGISDVMRNLANEPPEPGLDTKVSIIRQIGETIDRLEKGKTDSG